MLPLAWYKVVVEVILMSKTDQGRQLEKQERWLAAHDLWLDLAQSSVTLLARKICLRRADMCGQRFREQAHKDLGYDR